MYLFVSAKESGFVSENLLETKVDLKNSTGMYVYNVYASDSLDTLYDEGSLIAEKVQCKDYTGANVKVSVKAKYIAIVVTEHKGVRIRRIKVIGEKMPDATFVTEMSFQVK